MCFRSVAITSPIALWDSCFENSQCVYLNGREKNNRSDKLHYLTFLMCYIKARCFDAPVIFRRWALTWRPPVWADVHASITSNYWQISALRYIESKEIPFKCTYKGCLVKETDRIENRFSRFSLFFIRHSQLTHTVGISAPTDQLTAIDLRPVTNYRQISSVSPHKRFADPCWDRLTGI